MCIAISGSALADEVRLPAATEILQPGACAKTEMVCYDRPQFLGVAEYATRCVTYKREAEECAKNAERLISISPWWKSPVFWGVVGVAVGFGVTSAVYATR